MFWIPFLPFGIVLQVEFEQSVVSGLGTVCVKGFHEPYSDSGGGGIVRSGASSPQKPILVSPGEKYVKYKDAWKGLWSGGYRGSVCDNIVIDVRRIKDPNLIL